MWRASSADVDFLTAAMMEDAGIPETPSSGMSMDSSPLSCMEAYDLIDSASQGNPDSSLPFRPQASPICLDITRFYVASQRDSGRNFLSEKDPQLQLGDPENHVAVKYQSFSNGEIWWSSGSGLRGIVSRNMSKRSGQLKTGSLADDCKISGKCFCLLERKTVSEEVTTENVKRYMSLSAPSLVEFSYSIEYQRSRKRTRLPDAWIADPIVLSPIDRYEQEPDLTVKGNLVVHGDAFFSGNLVVDNLRVSNNLIVLGGISGQLITPLVELIMRNGLSSWIRKRISVLAMSYNCVHQSRRSRKTSKDKDRSWW